MKYFIYLFLAILTFSCNQEKSKTQTKKTIKKEPIIKDYGFSENLGVSEKAVVEMDQRLGSSGQEMSLDRPLDDDGGRQTLGDIIGNEDESAEAKLADLQNLEILQQHLGDFLKGLKPRDQEIFKKRLLSEIPESLQSIADQYGVSRERIRQVEERLIDQLKIYMSEFLR